MKINNISFKQKYSNFISLSLVILLTNCGGGNGATEQDTPTNGSIVVASDESFQPFMEAEEEVFEHNYSTAKISIAYKPENEAINMLLNDKARVAVVTRELTPKEQIIFTQEKIKYRSVKVAYDAVALITNKSNKDTGITVQEFGDLMMKKKTKWSQVGKNGSNEEVVMVFDNSNSSNLIYMMQKYGLKDKSKLPFYAVKGNKEVIEYVKTHSNALGLIGVNWISDGDDPSAKKFIGDINVLSVADKSTVNDAYYQPFGYNILYKWYPFRRDVYVLLKEPWMGLGSGFMNYIATDQGQLVILKAGLIPATRPVYIQNVKTGGS